MYLILRMDPHWDPKVIGLTFYPLRSKRRKPDFFTTSGPSREQCEASLWCQGTILSSSDKTAYIARYPRCGHHCLPARSSFLFWSQRKSGCSSAFFFFFFSQIQVFQDGSFKILDLKSRQTAALQGDSVCQFSSQPPGGISRRFA